MLQLFFAARNEKFHLLLAHVQNIYHSHSSIFINEENDGKIFDWGKLCFGTILVWVLVSKFCFSVQINSCFLKSSYFELLQSAEDFLSTCNLLKQTLSWGDSEVDVRPTFWKQNLSHSFGLPLFFVSILTQSTPIFTHLEQGLWWEHYTKSKVSNLKSMKMRNKLSCVLFCILCNLCHETFFYHWNCLQKRLLFLY